MMDGTVENGCQEARVDVMEQENPLSKHGHLLMSGPLGICDNPYCTICPSYFTSVGASVSMSPSKNAFFSGAKTMHGKLVGWSKYRFSPVMNPHTKMVQWWNQFFVISCLFAIFVDPLFFFLFSVRQGNFYITFNVKAAIVVTILRSLTDFIYFLHMLLQFRLAYVVPASRTVGAGELVDDPKQIAHHYLRRWFIFDLFSVLPAPQIITWILFHRLNSGKENANFAKNLLRATVLLQYIPRCIRFVPLAVGSFAFETARANFVINLLIYLLAGHVIGCSWYLLAFQRVYTCLRQVYLNETGCNPHFPDSGIGKDFSSYFQTNTIPCLNISQASKTCLVEPSFRYGIYANAVPVTLKTQIISKYVYSLFWGFLQLSTLAGNLVPSLFVWEILFTMGIIGLGLLLFALLIGNMQTYLLSLSRRQMDVQLRRHDVETWMKHRNLPFSLRRRVREKERFKWAATQGVDEEKLLDELSEDLQKDIHNVLYLNHLKKVRLFTVMEDIVVDAISERLHQRFYIKDSVILRTNYPVGRMLFILRGKLESIGDDGFRAIINEGKFCGDELLTWCIENAAVQSNSRKSVVRKTGQRALSSRTVKCITNVEAFSLEAADLVYVANNFNRCMRNPRVQGAIRYESLYWRSWASGLIQAAWKYRKRKRNNSLLWTVR